MVFHCSCTCYNVVIFVHIFSLIYVQELRKTKGLDNPEGFKYAFTLLEVWTADYQLDNVDKLVTEIFPMCKRHGGQWYIKAVQVQI